MHRRRRSDRDGGRAGLSVEAIDIIATAALGLAIVAVAPLLLLGVYALANAVGIRSADRLLGPLIGLVQVQWGVAALVNLGGGLALAGLGLWTLAQPGTLALAGLALIPFGLWRCWIGIGLIRALRSDD